MKKISFQMLLDSKSVEERENLMLQYWEENKIFEKSISERPKDKPYHFYDGPPFATGLPHYGHIVASLMKDVVPRFWTMKGFRVERKWGWDCHGLPIENIIEKELGLKTKQDIEKFGIDKFNEACRATVLRYAKDWKKTVRRMGRWVDMENDYKTMDRDFMESVWWVFKSLWDRNLIYRGHKSMHICPRCVTPLSNFEVTQGYKDITDSSVVVMFKIINSQKLFSLNDVRAIAWTTTPWTLPGNMLLAVHPNHQYILVKIKKDNKIHNVLIASDRAQAIFNENENEVIKSFSGQDLIDMKISYEPLFPYYQDTKNAYRIVGGDFVTMDEGTGIVHIAPAFGEDDYAIGTRENIELVQHVSMEGKFNDRVSDFAGLAVKPKDDIRKTDILLINWLSERDKLFYSEKIKHSYPHCWRCDTPLLNYATTSWFVRVMDLKKDLLNNNEKIRWVPENMKNGRFGQWLESVRDWAVSRNRYWGTPLPVWESEDGDLMCIGSVKELEELTGQSCQDLHKHVIDKFEIQKNGKKYRRIPEVFDCWFESGSMPYGQMHYPFENKDQFESSFPAQFIAEGQDQTRGWFYTLHVLATALTVGKNPAIPVDMTTPGFLNVIVNGIVLAQDGKKMSKRLKNYPDPQLILQQFGADAMRYYLVSSPVMEAQSINFSEKGVRDIYNRVVNTLWNTLVFFDKYAVSGQKMADNLHVLDKWILSRLAETFEAVTKGMENYQLVFASRPIEDFVQDLSGWYVRRCRNRMKNDISKAEVSAVYEYVLKLTSQMIAPFMPFMAEMINMKLDCNAPSIHLSGWPVNVNYYLDSKVIEDMSFARKIVEKIHSARKDINIPVRQALGGAKVFSKTQLSEEYKEIIKEETNILKLEWANEDGDMYIELDTNMTPELIEMGQTRELVRMIQQLRKDNTVGINRQIKISVPEKYSNLSIENISKIKSEANVSDIIWAEDLKILI